VQELGGEGGGKEQERNRVQELGEGGALTLFLASTSAPWLTRWETTLEWPFSAAQCSGVHWSCKHEGGSEHEHTCVGVHIHQVHMECDP